MRFLICLSFITILACKNGDNAKSEFALGLKDYSMKSLESAENHFRSALKMDPDLLNALLMIAKINYYRKDYSTSVENLEQILKKDPDHSGALYWKARNLIITGADGDDESTELLCRTLETDSHHIPARMLLALIYEKKGKYKEAVHEYIAALNEEETIIRGRGNLAILYRRLGLKDRAMREIDTAIKIAKVSGLDMEQLKIIQSELEKWED